MTEKQLPNYTWIKFKIDYIDDPDFMQLSEGAISSLTKMYLLAGKADAGGLLCNGSKIFSAKDLAWRLRIQQDHLDQHLTELANAGFISNDGEGFRISHFLEEQGPGDNSKREQWNERQRRHRENHALKKFEAFEGLSTKKDKDKETEVDRDIDIDIESHGDVTVTPKPPRERTTTASSSLILDYEKEFQKLEEMGGGFFPLEITTNQPGYDLFEKSADSGYYSVWGMIQFAFIWLNTETKLAEKGIFIMSIKELNKILEFFANYPVIEKTDDDGDPCKEVQFDQELFANAITFYFWKWHATGRKKFDASEILSLYKAGENYIDQEIDNHPEYYRDSEAVRIVSEITREAIPELLMPDIYATVGDNFSLPKLARPILLDYFKTWRARGYSSKNFDWFFDWFANEKDVWSN